MSLQIDTVRENEKERKTEKMRQKWPWPTYKQHRPIIRRLQQLHVAVGHSSSWLGKWTHPNSSLRVTLMIYS